MNAKLFNTLTPEKIDGSPEIKLWLEQFSLLDQVIGKILLSRLRFVSISTYQNWLVRELDALNRDTKFALYAVRKLEQGEESFFYDNGEPLDRPSESQGSEDLVNSLIANYVKDKGDVFYDHPSVNILRDNQIRALILIEDSIGSGRRISDFINAILKNRTIRSWWSFGWLQIKIFSFSRVKETENKIIDSISGRDHAKTKIRRRDKISFTSAYVYNSTWINNSWGDQYESIRDLCLNTKKVQGKYRLGYKETFSNIIFYHSVPNNIPGVLWFHNAKWHGLMPKRNMPSWLINLLDSATSAHTRRCINNYPILSLEAMNLLKLIKSNVRAINSISLRLNVDNQYAKELIRQAINLNLITQNKRLTKFGLTVLLKKSSRKPVETYNYELYTPTSWSID